MPNIIYVCILSHACSESPERACLFPRHVIFALLFMLYIICSYATYSDVITTQWEKTLVSLWLFDEKNGINELWLSSDTFFGNNALMMTARDFI